MKKLFLLSVLCSALTTVVFSNTPAKVQNQTNCSGILQLSAKVVYPVRVSFYFIGANVGLDDIELAVYADDMTTIITHFTKHVVMDSDTTIYIGKGKYFLTVLSGGTKLKSPYLFGANILSDPRLWTDMTNGKTMEFNVLDNLVCGGQYLLNAKTYYNGTGRLKYKWTPSTGLDNDTLQMPKATVTGNITYRVTVTSPGGCTATDTIKAVVRPLTVAAGSPQAIVCGGLVPLNGVTTNYDGSGQLKYKWTPSTGLNSDTLAYPMVSLTGNITYSVTVTSPGGCSATADVRVSVLPFTANAGADKSVVSGGTVLLNTVTSNYYGTGTLKYKWTPSSGLNNDTIASPSATVNVNTTYTVQVTTPGGCTATDNIAVTIVAMAKPDIGIVGVTSTNKNRVVWNKPVSTGIASYSVYKETSVTNTFEKVGSIPYDSLSVFVDNQSAPNVKSSKYKLSIVDRNGLESPLSNAHKTMHLSINKGQNNTWNLIWEPYEGFIVSTYNIYRGTSPLTLGFVDAVSGSSTQFSDLDAPAGDTYYQLEVISPTIVSPTKITSLQKSKAAENSTLVTYSSSRSNIATNVVAGLFDSKQNYNIQVYPNPVNDCLKIEFVGGSTFEILNIMGQVVYKGDLTKNNSVETSGFSAGTYLIKIKSANSYVYTKIIKE